MCCSPWGCKVSNTTERLNNNIYVYIYLHTHNRILLSHKKYEIMPFVATWMDLEILILSEVSQKEKDKYHMISGNSG